MASNDTSTNTASAAATATATATAEVAPVAAGTESSDVARQVRDLITSLSSLPSNETMSHYRHVPVTVQAAYETMRQAATNIQATSLKYALLRGAVVQRGVATTRPGDALSAAGASFVADCNLLVTACTTLWDDSLGCATNTRSQARRAVQSILTTVAQQLECAVLDPDYGPRAGAVEETCRYLTNKKLAVGNRNALRRDLLTYVMECRSTGTEFQQVIDQTSSSNDGADQEESNDTNDWGDGNDEDTYSTLEMPIAKACVAILLCSRWCLNASLAALDAVGDVAATMTTTTVTNETAYWVWMSRLHQLATATGLGVTDLGVALYPPLDLVTVQTEVERQALVVQQTVQHILVQANTPVVANEHAPTMAWSLPLEVTDVAHNVQKAIATRQQQALDAILAASVNQSVSLSPPAE